MKTIQLLAFVTALGSQVLLAGGPSQTRFETLYKFAGIPDGETPQGLVAGPNGVLYGTTSYGGAFGYGSVFELRPPAAPDGKWTETVIYSFAGSSSDGAFPYASPIVGANGAIYGTTAFGGYTGSGTVFELIPPASPGGAWTETVLFTFYAGGDNGGTGYDVYRGLVAGSNGELYGVASEGGLFYFGTAFELTPPIAPGGTWTFSVIYSFTGDGREPAGLTISADGVLYGTTSYGGSAGAGTVFELTPPTAPGGAWTGGTIYAFTGGADGDAPLQPPVIANDGTLYGTTSAGGGSGSGTVFELRPPATPDGAWTETVLYDLSSSGDGKIPDSPLIVRKGVIYGTTAAGSGSKSAGGTVFQLRRPGTGGPWTETVLHGFAGTAGPAGSLVMDESGAIYGTTTSGPGPNGAGTAYGINP